jgi:class 3 adenylate cyclase
MRRKIAAILVAHIADYGRLVADDEEETLRRMASCRSTIDDFIAIAGGRVFNTAGDALLAEFSSAVEAVRCAIESRRACARYGSNDRTAKAFQKSHSRTKTA